MYTLLLPAFNHSPTGCETELKLYDQCGGSGNCKGTVCGDKVREQAHMQQPSSDKADTWWISSHCSSPDKHTNHTDSLVLLLLSSAWQSGLLTALGGHVLPQQCPVCAWQLLLLPVPPQARRCCFNSQRSKCQSRQRTSATRQQRCSSQLCRQPSQGCRHRCTPAGACGSQDEGR